MTFQQQAVHPLLSGHWAPWPMEGHIDDVQVTQGCIPDDLNGSLFRLGLNMRYPQNVRAYYPLVADGMVHGLRLENGKAHYRNRWVRTPRFELEDKHGRAMFEYQDDFGDWRCDGFAQYAVDKPETRGVPLGASNVTAWTHRGRVYALGEFGLPMEIEPHTLETLGAPPWSADLPAGILPRAHERDGSMGPHPKNCPVTGEIFWFTLNAENPRIEVQSYDPACGARRNYPVELPFTPWMHDWLLTENYIVLPVFPIVIRMDNPAKGLGAKVWEPERGTTLVIIPRNGGPETRINTFADGIRFVFHPQAAFERDGHLLCHVPEFPNFVFPAENNAPGTWGEMVEANLCEWDIDLAAGTVKAARLDDRSIEFPQVDGRYYGREYRYGFNACAVHGGGASLSFDGLIRYDMGTGAQAVHDFGAGTTVQEPIFVERSADAPEGDGYLLTYVYHPDTDRSDFVILDAMHLDGEPVATLALPHRVPFCNHGSWRAAT